MAFLVQSREAIEHNTDPQRRCYNGCHARSAWVWTAWSTLCSKPTLEEAEARAQEWRSYQRRFGGSRRLEYRAVPEDMGTATPPIDGVASSGDR